MRAEYSCGLLLSAVKSLGCRSYSQLKCLFGSGSTRVWSIKEPCILFPPCHLLVILRMSLPLCVLVMSFANKRGSNLLRPFHSDGQSLRSVTRLSRMEFLKSQLE